MRSRNSLRQILSHLTHTTEQQARRPTPEPIPSYHGDNGDGRDDDDDDNVPPPSPFVYYPPPEPQMSPALTHTSPLQLSETHSSPLQISHTHTSPLYTPPTHSPMETTEAKSHFLGDEIASPPKSPQFHQPLTPIPTLHTTPPSSPIYTPIQPSPRAYHKQGWVEEEQEGRGFDLNVPAAVEDEDAALPSPTEDDRSILAEICANIEGIVRAGEAQAEEVSDTTIFNHIFLDISRIVMDRAPLVGEGAPQSPQASTPSATEAFSSPTEAGQPTPTKKRMTKTTAQKSVKHRTPQPRQQGEPAF